MEETDNLLSEEQIKNMVQDMYADITEVPKEHLDQVEQHAQKTADNINLYLTGCKSKYILKLVKKEDC